MIKPELQPKPPRDDATRRDYQKAVKRSLIELPAFGLVLLAAQMVRDGDDAGYSNYDLPGDPAALAFTLKGALRLEMMNSQIEAYKKYRRLFGSNTKAKDLGAWRSRVYVEAFASGPQAARAAKAMLLPGSLERAEGFLQTVANAQGSLVLLQVNDVYLDESRTRRLSDLLLDFLNGESRLLRGIGSFQVVPGWKEAAQ